MCIIKPLSVSGVTPKATYISYFHFAFISKSLLMFLTLTSRISFWKDHSCIYGRALECVISSDSEMISLWFPRQRVEKPSGKSGALLSLVQSRITPFRESEWALVVQKLCVWCRERERRMTKRDSSRHTCSFLLSRSPSATHHSLFPLLIVLFFVFPLHSSLIFLFQMATSLLTGASAVVTGEYHRPLLMTARR